MRWCLIHFPRSRIVEKKEVRHFLYVSEGRGLRGAIKDEKNSRLILARIIRGRSMWMCEKTKSQN